MSVATAVGMVSESLKRLLEQEMTIADVGVTVLAPDETGGDRRINLFLYKVMENPHLRNEDWRAHPTDPGRIVPPPLSLNLFYLVTPYAPNDLDMGNANAHAILGEAMRVFYENPVVPPAALSAGLQDARESIKVMLSTLDLDELSRVWSTFTQPFRLSVLYEVSVVQLDMLPASERDMAPRVREIGMPSVRAPYVPPLVSDMSPVSGTIPAAGLVVQFTGSNLSGWSAYVTVSGSTILDGQEIVGDQFEATLPADLAEGFHEVRVDISHLYRTTFFFEVTGP